MRMQDLTPPLRDRALPGASQRLSAATHRLCGAHTQLRNNLRVDLLSTGRGQDRSVGLAVILDEALAMEWKQYVRAVVAHSRVLDPSEKVLDRYWRLLRVEQK